MNQTAVLTMASFFILVHPTFATEKKPLPDFQVTSAQGHVFSSLQLAGRGRWLLVAISPTDPLCDRLLAAFLKWPESRWLAKTTFVVEAPAQDAQAYLQKQFPDQWQRLSWVSDESRHAVAAFGLQGLPVLIGMDQAQIQWTIGGVLSDPAKLETIVQSWLR